MRRLIFLVAIMLAGCSAQQWPSWTRTEAENACYDNHNGAACYLAHQQEMQAWVGLNQQVAQSFGPGSQFNPVYVRVQPY